MIIDLRVPNLGESIVEATVGKWHKQLGDPVWRGQVIVELETDKVYIEVEAEVDGFLLRIDQPAGSNVAVGQFLGAIENIRLPEIIDANVKSLVSNINISSIKANLSVLVDLISTKKRHIQVLQKQIAKFGEIHAPSHFFLQVDDYQVEIDQLSEQSQNIKDTAVQSLIGYNSHLNTIISSLSKIRTKTIELVTELSLGVDDINKVKTYMKTDKSDTPTYISQILEENTSFTKSIELRILYLDHLCQSLSNYSINISSKIREIQNL